MTRRVAAFAITAGALAAALLLGGALHGASPKAERRPPSDAAAERLLDGFAPGDTAAYVDELERRLELEEDGAVLARLGLAYQQRARETGDPSFYARSEEALRHSLRVGGDDFLATTGLAALAGSRHRFGEAAKLARRAVRMRPASAPPYGILGDALLELGRYREAFAAYDRMVTLKPALTSYARVSHARELLGDTPGALAAMKLAVDAAATGSEAAAWARSHLGNLYLETGRLRAADRHYRNALRLRPDYAPALAGRANVEAARRRLDLAARLLRQALELTPLPEYSVALGDVLARGRRGEAAEAAYARASALEARFAANGGRNQLETALFDLDHDRDLVTALRRARAGYRERPGIEGAHVLAWALYKNRRCEEARRHSVRALRLGTKDLGALYHRALIERCLGNRHASEAFLARVRAINRYFLLAPPSARQVAPTR